MIYARSADALRLTWAVLLAVALTFVPRDVAAASPRETIKVLVPDRGNLQYMSFWVAKGAGYFAEEGIEIELVIPPGPQQTAVFFERHDAEVAVLPPPMYLGLIANKVPVVLVANLLANDPIELIVRRSIMTERKLSPDMPIKARLEGLRGLKIGVAPHPPTRLRALFASQGLDVDKDAELVILHGKEQNAAFHDGEVDVLYAHTPFLERAILHDDAVVLVDQSRGEIPQLANRQIHGLGVNRALLETRRELVISFVRAIDRAQKLVHRSQPETVNVLAKEMPDRDRKELETIVRLYEPAIPRSPTFLPEEIPTAMTMFPAGMTKPDLTGVDFKKHAAPDLLVVATAPPQSDRSWKIIAAVALATVLAIVFFVRRGRKQTA